MISLFLAAGLITTPGTMGPQDCARVTSAQVGYRFSGRAVHVVDADTLDIARPGGCVRVRLTDFDGREDGQPGYHTGKSALTRITAGKLVSCRVERGRDGRRTVSHDRVLARCSVNGVALGKRLKAARVPQGGN
jgi:hypothetical protein